MYIIFTDTYIPYEYDTLEQCMKHIKDCSHGIKKSMRLVERNMEHVLLRCPIAGDYLDILASVDELNALHKEMIRQNLYRL